MMARRNKVNQRNMAKVSRETGNHKIKILPATTQVDLLLEDKVDVIII